MEELRSELKSKAEHTASQDAQTEEIKEEASKVEDNDLKQPEEESLEEESLEVDYKDELNRLQEERDNYKQGMLNAKQENKELKGQVNTDGVTTLDEDLVDESFEERIANRVAETLKEEQRNWQHDRLKDETEELIDSYSSSDEEKELIKYHLENTVKVTGSDRRSREEAIQNAKLLANRRKIERDNEELREALKVRSRINTMRSVSGSRANKDQYNTSQFSAADLDLLNRHKITPKEAAKKMAKKVK